MNDTQVVLRMPAELARRLKAHARKLSKKLGVRVSTSEAHRKLLAEALERENENV